jgi:hypothetical protein
MPIFSSKRDIGLSTYLKPILVFIISALLFVGAINLANFEIIDYVQARFYNPSVINSFIKENNKDAELIQSHLTELQSLFSNKLNEPAIRNSFLHNQSAEDIYERSRITGILMETVTGLQMVQFVDGNGIRIHFSTSARDIISQTRESTAYRNYNEDPRALPYDNISVLADETPKLTMDEVNERIIFSYPFFDSMNIYRGTALFSLSVRALAEKLITEGRLKTIDDVSVIGDPPGVVIGSPETSKTVILQKIASVWSEGVEDNVILDAGDSGITFALITARTEQNLFFGRLINASIFSIPEHMENIFKLSMFLTFYLTLFFLTNIKPNPVMLVRSRLKKLQANLFEQLYINKTSKDRTKWVLELEQRRDEIRAQLKHKVRLSKKQEKNIDSMIDKSLDELLTVIKSGSGIVITTKPVMEKPDKLADEPEEAEAIDEIDEIEEAEEVEEVEEVEEADEIEEIDDADEIEEVDEIEDAEEIEEVEAIGTLDDVELIEEVEAIDTLDDVEQFDEAETIDTLDDVEQFDEAETIDTLDNVEQFDEAETIDTLDDVEQFDEVEAIDTLDDVELIEEAEAAEEAPAFIVSADTPPQKKKGLFERASKYEKAEEEIESLIFEDLEELEEIDESPPAIAASPSSVTSTSTGTGLLARASATTTRSQKGLLALASEIEFSVDYPVYEDDEQDLIAEVNIVSPFSSMFSKLS